MIEFVDRVYFLQFVNILEYYDGLVMIVTIKYRHLIITNFTETIKRIICYRDSVKASGYRSKRKPSCGKPTHKLI